MASITIIDLDRGEAPGENYSGILNAVFHEIFTGNFRNRRRKQPC